MVAQSGAFQVGASSFTGRMGKAIDVGNACDLDVVDVLEYLADDPQTRIIVLHLEGIKRGRQFLTTAARVARSKPIIALKTGRSVAGAKAAMSHTGSLVGEDAMVDLALAAAGIIRVRTLVEMLAVSRAFLHFRPMAGPRLGVATATGAFGIIAADACEDHGLELAPFPEPLRELEEERIPWHKLAQPRGPLAPGHGHGLLYRGFQAGRGRPALPTNRWMPSWGWGRASPRPAMPTWISPAAVRELHAANPQHKPLALLLYGDEAAHRAQAGGTGSGTRCGLLQLHG